MRPPAWWWAFLAGAVAFWTVAGIVAFHFIARWW
jgi:hypothetical protein